MYADVLKNVSLSSSIAVSDAARKLSAAGHDVISLSMGEPDLDTPDAAKQAAIKAIQSGYTKYTALNGIVDLREAIAEKFAKENGLKYSPAEIIVSNGAKQAIFNAFFSTLNQENNVLIPAPYWVSYPDMVSLTRAKPRICATNSRNILEAGELEKNIDENTRWLILNSPSNPTGAVYYPEDLREIANVLIKHPHVYVLSDDVYEHIIYDNVKFYNILNVAPELKDRVLVVNALSKSHAMTGWRVGYAAGPKRLIDAMSVVQSQTTSCASSISQHAAVGALKYCADFMRINKKIFQERRDLVYAGLSEIKPLKINKPEGAFYLLLNCENFIDKTTVGGRFIRNDAELASYILNEHMVALVPGGDFGAPGTLRISYAASKERLAEAVLRLKRAFDNIKI